MLTVVERVLLLRTEVREAPPARYVVYALDGTTRLPEGSSVELYFVEVF